MSVKLYMRMPGKWIHAQVREISEEGRFVIQVASFKSRETADLVVLALRDTLNRGGIGSVELKTALIEALQKERVS